LVRGDVSDGRSSAASTLDDVVRPKQTALLVIDVQNDFCHPRGALAQRGNDVSRLWKLREPIETLMQEASAAGVMVIALRIVGSTATDSEAWAALSARDDIPLVLEDSWGAEYVEGFPVHLADREIVKRRHSGFVGTGLDELLRSHGIRTVVLAGGVTNVCVEGTAREAADRDYFVVVLRDGTAAVRADLHEMTLFNIQKYFGRVCDVDAVVAAWRNHRDRTAVGHGDEHVQAKER
jgi:ureidoacrylate peracid hydrolase